MKLIGFKHAGASMIGRVYPNGTVAPLTDIDSFYSNVDSWIAHAKEVRTGSLVLADVQQVPPVPRSASVICIGLNYRAHAAEGKLDVGSYPVVFGRWPGSLSVDGAPIPMLEEKLDWEGELAVVIRDRAFRVGEAEAMDHVLAYAPFNDISARTYQTHTSQWTLGKNGDGSGPLGILVTTEEVGDPATGLALTTRVNGEVVQQTTTDKMVFSIPRIICYVSEIMTLSPGDVIATGTPEGVGMARTPPRFMKVGDVVDVEIERVGTLRNSIVSRAEYEAGLRARGIS